jgi:hypothetical protein
MGSYQLPPDVADSFNDLADRVARLEATSGRILASALPEVTTSSVALVDLGGPSLTFDVGPGSFVALFVEADMKNTSSGPRAQMSVVEPTDIPSGFQVLSQSGSVYLKTVTTSFVTFHATPGRRTYTIKYSVDAGTGFFQNRRMWGYVF